MADKKLSIGFLIDTNLDSNDGVQQYVKRLGAWYSQQGHDVRYLTSDSTIKEWSGSPVYSLARKITVKFNANRITMPIWPRLKDLDVVLDDHNFDVLHVQAFYSPLLAQIIINRIDNKTAVVGTFHVMPTNFLQGLGARLLKFIYGRSLKRFDVFTAPSQAAADFAHKTLGVSPIVIPNPVALEDFKLTSSRPKNPKPKIVFLGRLVERKGAQWLLQAVLILKDRGIDFEVVIAGGGPLRVKLEAYVTKHQLSDIVSFAGFIDEADKPTLLRSADVACFPAMYGEAFGIVLIEAMASGSGVILAGDNPGYRSVLGEQPEMLIEVRDARAFADRLYEFMTNKELAQKLHSWQESQVGRYDTKQVADSTLKAYVAAIAKRSDS